MTRPRAVLPGRTYFFTRRTAQRQYWLRPSARTTQILEYCTAYAANETNLDLYAVMGMSNHVHDVAHDTEGRYPQFLHRKNLLIAKCINASYGRWEALWSSAKPSVVELLDDETILDKIAYTLANPVSAGLVANGHNWPGMRSRPDEFLRKPRLIKRPPVFFKKDTEMPEFVELRIKRPHIFPELSDQQLAKRLRTRVEQVEQQARDDMKQAGRTFLGRARIRQVKPTDAPATKAPRRNLNPRFAFKSRRRFLAAVLAERRWRADYDRCRARLLNRDHDDTDDIIFPAGTWAVARHYGVRVPPAAPT